MSEANPLERLTLELGRLPGIGARTAMRLSHFILQRSHEQQTQQLPTNLGQDLGEALINAVAKVGLCQQCRNFAVDTCCTICSDRGREHRLLCVVEGVADLNAIERSGAFRGVYYVLHGVLSPLDGMGPEALGVDRLLELITNTQVDEVIVATNAHVEGDATAMYLSRCLQPHVARVTRLATGIPMGGELEYLDRSTLDRALQQRYEIEAF